VQRLAIYGFLHVDLVPYIWPDSDKSKEYWAWARSEQGQGEGRLWERDVAAGDQDYEKVLSLLEGCDIVHRISKIEMMAPALLTRKTTPHMDAR
jgi:hypothetical protein